MSGSRADLVDRVIAAVTATEGVVEIHGGGPGSPATYLPGRTVRGIRLDDEKGQVSVVLAVAKDTDLIALANRVRSAATQAAGRPMDVVVADIAIDDPADPTHDADTAHTEELNA